LLRSIAEISTLAEEVANLEVNPPEPSDGVPPEAWERHQRMMVMYAKAFEWTGKAMDIEAVTFGLKYDAQFPEHAFRRAYRHTPPVADFLDESVEQWLQEGMCYYVYEPSPVCSPIFAVDVESDSGRRMRAVIDYHVPNEAMLDSNYPLPIFHEVLCDVVGCYFFNALDVKSAFHLIPLAEELQVWTTFL
jgi:hypothetical protein